MKSFLSAIIFLWFNVSSYSGDLNNAIDSAKQAYNHAKAIYSLIENDSRIISKFNPNLPVNLPLGISKSIGDNKFIVALDSVSYSPGGGKLSAYLLAKFPLASDSIGFFAKNVEFNKGGITSGRLLLIGDKTMALFPNTANLIISGARRNSYIDFDCNGYKDASLDCKVEFDSSVIKPVDNINSTVSASFTITTDSGFGDFLVSNVSLSSPFQISSLNGFTFRVNNLAYDNSIKENPSGITFPKDYSGSTGPDWEGFYAGSASITFPPEFKNDSGDSISLMINNFIIDKDGVSGYVEGDNLIKNGDMFGWAYTMDKIKIEFSKNSPKEFEIDGTLTIPMFSDTTKFNYVAQVDASGNMLFSVKLDENRTYDLTALSSKLSLFQNSYIEIKRENGKITPKAVFNGQLSVQATEANVQVANIVFSSMIITANPFSFSIDKFALRGKSQNFMSGFPITLHDIALIKDGNKVGLDVSVLLNFAPSDEKGFSADAGFSITSDLDISNGKFNGIKNTDVTLKKIYVAANMGFLSIKGEIDAFHKDPTYGNGFRGMLDAVFKPGIGVKSTAYFGNVNSYRYWYVDALVTIPTPIVVFPAFGIYGFGGGAYYHMVRRGAAVQLPSVNTAKTTLDSTSTGNSSSGTMYVPDRNTVFGCKATIEIGTVSSRKAFNGNGTLELVFNGTGLKTVGLYANAYFLTDIDQRDKASVKASLSASLDVQEWSFIASLQVFVNIEGVLHGAQANNLAGTAYMKFSKNRWYIYIGKPDMDDRIGVMFSFLGSAKVTSYFDVGDSIPAKPSLKDLIPNYTGGLAESSQRDISSINTGAGFAFGASLNASLNYKLWRILLDGGIDVGFDVMLKNFGKSTHCEGRNGVVGFHGWYAMGDAYAYAYGRLRFDAGWLGTHTIASLEAWVILEAELPNPSYFAGDAGIKYDICGFSGSFDFTLHFGDECKVAGGKDLTQAAIIKSVDPKNGTDSVSIAKDIVVNFNQPIEQKFTLSSNNFKINLTELTLKQGNSVVKCDSVWSYGNKTLTIRPKGILSAKTSYTVSIIVTPKTQLPGTGSWVSIIENNNEVTESRSVDFHTGNQTKIQILPENVSYSYPLPLQANVYKSIFDSGYIFLKKPQPELLKMPANFSNCRKEVRLTPTNGTPIIVDLNINANASSFNYTLPNLSNNTIYKMEIVYSDTTGNYAKTSPTPVVNEEVLYTTWFRTSIYPYFSNKIASFTHQLSYNPELDNKTYALAETFVGREFFDGFEFSGNSPLLTCRFDTTGDSWVQNLKALFYNQYNPGGPSFDNIAIVTDGTINSMTEADARLGVFNFNNQSVSISFHGDNKCYQDYLNAIAKAGALLPDYVNIGKSGHKVVFSYYLPGRKTPLTNFVYNLK